MNVSVDPLASSHAFHFFQGEALVVKHRLVDLKQSAILIEHKHMLRKEIYELSQLALFLSQFRFRVSNFLKGASQCFLRPLALDCDASDVPCAFNERKIFVGGNSRLVRVKCESAQYLVVLRQDWF